MAGSASSSSKRYISLRVAVLVQDVEPDVSGRPQWKKGTEQSLGCYGGTWDTKKKRWRSTKAGKGDQVLALRFHRGQEAAARWFAEWLRRFVRNDWRNVKRMWSVLLIGGRRSGKTFVICAFMVLFGLLYPKSLQWAISPTLETGDELDENFRAMLPRGWAKRYQAKTGRATTYTFANGSRLLLRSGVKPQRLKAGRADLVFLNESQEMTFAAYKKVRAAIVDRGGIVILAANPPETPAGRWVEDHYNECKAGRRDGIVFELDPRQNPWINYEGLASMGKEVDAQTFERDVLGLFPPIGDVVMHGWSDQESIREVPDDFEDVTAAVTKAKLGRAANYIVGMDFQRTPHMAAAVIKIFRNPHETDPELELVPWVVDGVAEEDADEHDLLDALEAIPRWTRGAGAPDTRDPKIGHYRGWRNDADDLDFCVVVMDASAWWQDGAHIRNRKSNEVLAERRWAFCYRPRFEKDAKGELLRNNPEITERVKVTNSMLKSKNGPRRLFSCHHCAGINRAMRSWENTKLGVPNRHSDFAHLCDAVSYVIYRFFGKPKLPSRKLEYHSAGKYSRADDVRGW